VDHLLGFVVRATATYVFLLVLLRISGKRTIGEGTPFDFVVALVLGDFPDDMIWGEVPVAQALVAMGTVTVIHLSVVYAAYVSPRVATALASSPTPIIRAGRSVPHGLRQTWMNEGDLDVLVREQGRTDRREVDEMLFEETGEASMRPTVPARPARMRDLEDEGAA
jgi:uncharacterized membrane protein YcaP (DUF421 family)